MRTVSFDEISDLFNENAYYYDNLDLFWYRYMWELLERQKLTQFDDEKEYYSVYLRAVALIYMFQGFVSEVEGVQTLPQYIYENSLTDIIPEFVLGQLYAKEYPDDIIEEESYAVFVLAQEEYPKIRDAVLKEMSFEELFLTMVAVFHDDEEFTLNEDGTMDKVGEPLTYDSYLNLVTNHIEDIEQENGYNPHGAYEWVAINEAYFDTYD